MNFLKRLFTFFRASPSAGRVAPRGGSASGTTSVLALLMQQNIKIDAKPCGVDGQTTAIATCTPLLIASEARIQGVKLDVGGRCATCRAARCGDHSIWIAMTLERFKAIGGKGLLIDEFDEIMDEMAAITHKRVDMVFIMACRVCRSIYDSERGLQTFVLVD